MDRNGIMAAYGIDGYEKDGVVYLNLESCARGLGFTQTQYKNDKMYTSIRWERINAHLRRFGALPASEERPVFIPENIFYRLAMKARNKIAVKFQQFIADEVIPNIRRCGSYSKKLTRAEMILEQAKALIEQEKKCQTGA